MTAISPCRFTSVENTGDDCLERMGDEALSHPALNHRYLSAMSAGAFPDMAWAIRDYAWHYHGYSAWFPRYLQAVINRLEREDHRALLQVNLDEENGQLGEDEQASLRVLGIDPSSVDGVPHPALFRRFCTAMGISREALAAPAHATVRWRTMFKAFLEQSSPAASVGALGLGTESVVKPIYEQLLPAIRNLGFLSRSDYVFFELHCVVDDQHQEDLLSVARDLGTSAKGRNDIRAGMLTALDLRCELWDHLYTRAMSQRQAEAS